MELRNRIVGYEATGRIAIEATTAASKIPGMMNFFVKAKRGMGG